MSFFGALVDAASDFGQMAWSQYLNKKNMRDQAALQYDYAERYAKNSPSWNIQGLRDAGLNPILAVSNGVNLGANIPNISNSSPSGGGRGTKFMEAINAMKQNDIASRNASAAEESAGAATVQAGAATKQAEASLIKAKTDAIESGARIAKLTAESDLLKQDYKRNEANGGWRNEFTSDFARFLNKSINFFSNSLDKQRPESPDPRPLMRNSPHDGYDNLKFSPPTKEEEERWNNKPRRNSRRTVPISPLPYHSAL